MVVAQEGVTMTLAYRERILREDIRATCRHCGAERETLEHILAACESHNLRCTRSVTIVSSTSLPEPSCRVWGKVCQSASADEEGVGRISPT